MPECNIDARGKRVRLVGGLVCSFVGLLFLGLAGFSVTGVWGWWAGGGLLAGGLFQIYEARAGWCAVRAMGFRTPI